LFTESGRRVAPTKKSKVWDTPFELPIWANLSIIVGGK